ncbi:MAG TPA: hypothetical protein VKQ32_30250, partial [Polyangia bacterium]|nr:hypothetical protein [Polyangia bacterium]
MKRLSSALAVALPILVLFGGCGGSDATVNDGGSGGSGAGGSTGVAGTGGSAGTAGAAGTVGTGGATGGSGGGVGTMGAAGNTGGAGAIGTAGRGGSGGGAGTAAGRGGSGGGAGTAAGRGGSGGGSAGASGTGGSTGAGGTGGTTGTGGTSGLPQLTVAGNKLQDPTGKTIILRGTSLIDIGALYAYNGNSTTGITNRMDKVATAGVQGHAVRLPVYPKISYNGGSPYCSPLPYPVGTGPTANCTPMTPMSAADYVAKVLKPAIDYARSKNLYVIIDWHQIDNAVT